MPTLCRKCKRLVGCGGKINDSDLLLFPHLKELVMRRCDEITGLALHKLPFLQTLDLRGSSGIYAWGWLWQLRQPHLTYLNIPLGAIFLRTGLLCVNFL